MVSQWLGALEYVYPIAVCSGTPKPILVVHQNTQGHLKLFGWDIHTGLLDILVPGRYCPAGISLLPDATGFSFIDNDRLRIKFFAKRSPRSCDFPDPVRQLNHVAWSNDGKGYCSALYHGHYAIFQVDQEGDCICVLASKMADYMYPNCLGETLYFIERSIHTPGTTLHYSIKTLSLSSLQNTRSSVTSLDDAFLVQQETDSIWTVPSELGLLLDCSQHAIMHLSMVHSTFGWFIARPSQGNSPSRNLEFTCFTVQFIRGRWQASKAFDFKVPHHLVFGGLGVHGQERLHESLFPLLPRYIRSSLYFTSMDESGFLGVYRYDPRNARIDRLTPTGIGTHFFAPLDIGVCVVCGGSVEKGVELSGKITLPVLS